MPLMPLVGGAVVFFLLRPTPPPVPPPPTKVEVLRPAVAQALVEAALFEKGISRQRISISPGRLKVSLPNGVGPAEVISFLRGRLAAVDARIKLSVRTAEQGTWVEVWSGGSKSLTLFLYRPRVQPPQISVVVDDLGLDLKAADAIMEAGEPLTLSLLPFRPHTREVAERAHRRGFEVMIHLPMEPRGYPLRDPGKGALLVSMEREEIRRTVRKLLQDVPYARGANNHMGSRFMEDPEKVAVVMEELRKRGLFFLDSLTTPHSQGLSLAQKMGLAAIGRDVFLDNDQDEEAFLKQWRVLLRRARRRGRAVGICHPYPSTIRALREALHTLDGVELVPLSWIVKGTTG